MLPRERQKVQMTEGTDRAVTDGYYPSSFLVSNSFTI